MENNMLFNNRVNNYIRRVTNCSKIYSEIINSIPDNYNEAVYRINDRDMVYNVLENFITGLNNNDAEGDLFEIYDVAIHVPTKSLIIANKGATLFSLSEKYETPHLVRHIGMCVYEPDIGMEYANVGLVGNVYDDKIVLRTESACTPSFVFGSQRCNCYYQWKNARELAANFNRINVPNISNGYEFEKWVQAQYKYEDGRHIYMNDSEIGFVLLHVDSQNGMGSGYTKDEFVFDLSERASMRHRGEYTSEQIYGATMDGGFRCIGIKGDPRSENGFVGYKITPIILDYLQVNKNVIMLTNNTFKIGQMESFGYNVYRIKSIGAVNVAGSNEAKERGEEFHHLDINGDFITFSNDYERIKEEIERLIKDKQNAYVKKLD